MLMAIQRLTAAIDKAISWGTSCLASCCSLRPCCACMVKGMLHCKVDHAWPTKSPSAVPLVHTQQECPTLQVLGYKAAAALPPAFMLRQQGEGHAAMQVRMRGPPGDHQAAAYLLLTWQECPARLQEERNKLDEQMMRSVRRATRDAEAVLFLVDAGVRPEDALPLLQPYCGRGLPIAVVLNKVLPALRLRPWSPGCI